jgi:hypothetical protein
MKRHVARLFLWSWMVACLFAVQAHAQTVSERPEAVVTDFYQWFLKHDNDQTYPLREPAITNYVASRTVERLKDDYRRGGPPLGVDYFLKVQDYDAQDWAAHIVTSPAVMLGEVAVVPVTFGSKDKISVLVFLRREPPEQGHWKVVKVDDTWDYN